jgi:ABC-type transport system involved in cytochrome c biogenesis permease subunit
MKLDLDGDGKLDKTLSPTEWLLDVWCYPELAAEYPLFRIENVDVLDAIGIVHDRGQRFDFEYLSYSQLLTPGRMKDTPGNVLVGLANRYEMKPAGERTPIEAHIVDSADQATNYNRLHQYLLVLGSPFRIDGAEFQKRLGGNELTLTQLADKGKELSALMQEFQEKHTDPAIGNLFTVSEHLTEIIRGDRGLPALFPPLQPRTEAEQWLGIGSLVGFGIEGRLEAGHRAMLQALQDALATTDHAVRQKSLLAFRDAVVERAKERAEYGKVELETYYLDASWHYRSLHWFLVALLVVAAGWLVPRGKWLWRAGIAATTLPLAFLTLDIVLRCVIRSRPPILNLYDTFLFIAAVGVAAAVVTEVLTKRRVAISLAPVFGAMLVMLARAFEVEDGKDQLAPLQAVLDTNYYLATHVTSINMGYAAGMFASFVGTLWLLMQAFGFRRHDQAFHKSVVRATYGMIAFGLIFAVFGTIYGGVWANDSWGRFWGWDPKENGALLICISQVALMHARMSGWVRDLGFCIGAALGGLVVAFSWFHVNLLGIGLHAYGFASSTKVALFTYYWIESLLVLVAVGGILLRRKLAAAKVPAGDAAMA